MDWLTGYLAGKRSRLSTGQVLTFNGCSTEYIDEVFDATWTEATKTITKTAGFANLDMAAGGTDIVINRTTGVTAGSNYLLATGISSTANTLVMSASIAATAGDLTGINVRFPHLNQAITCTLVVDFLIGVDDARVIYGASAPTITIDDAYLADRYGNTTAVVTAQAMTNYSWVGSDGFTSSAAHASGSGGSAVTLYVSPTGSDSYTYAQAQNMATPCLTAQRAYNLLNTNAPDVAGIGAGSRVKLLQGCTFTTIDSRVSGASFDKPHILESYWYDYGGGVGTPGVRPTISFTKAQTYGFNFHSSTGYGQNYHIIRNIRFYASDTTLDSRGTGINRTASGTHFYLDDCVLEGCGPNNVAIQSDSVTLGYTRNYLTIGRCISIDCYDAGSAHANGVFIAAWKNLLIHGTFSDRCGFKDNAMTKGDVFSHAFYIQATNGPAFVHSLMSVRAGMTSIQCRPGGSISGSVFSESPINPHLGMAGGRISGCFIDKACDRILYTDGSTISRGFGLTFAGGTNTTHPQSTGPTCYERNVCANFTGTDLRARYLDQATSPFISYEMMERSNTFYLAGGSRMFVTDDSLKPRQFTRRGNVHDVGSSGYPTFDDGTYSSFTWFDSDGNDLFSSNLTNLTRINSVYKTLAQYRTATSQDALTITTQPTYTDSTADIGDWYATIAGGSPTAADCFAFMRARTAGTWTASYDPYQAARWLCSRYVQTNLGAAYGVPAESSTSGSLFRIKTPTGVLNIGVA